jgi:alkanesulfonate monooxygenase SsuD/methylene tetrahydromethanopterin reductase-like flavin-dependent oxidoreductase (luciferase family)
LFENFTWASAIAASTRYSGIMRTCHVPLMHPVLVAKAAATIDHISNDRFNIMCGWFRPEFEMFDAHYSTMTNATITPKNGLRSSNGCGRTRSHGTS